MGLSVCVWTVAIATDHWFTLESPDNQGLPLGGAGNIGRRLIYKHMGLWRGCTTGLTPDSENATNLVPYSKYLQMRETREKKLKTLALDPYFSSVVVTGTIKKDRTQKCLYFENISVDIYIYIYIPRFSGCFWLKSPSKIEASLPTREFLK